MASFNSHHYPSPILKINNPSLAQAETSAQGVSARYVIPTKTAILAMNHHSEGQRRKARDQTKTTAVDTWCRAGGIPASESTCNSRELSGHPGPASPRCAKVRAQPRAPMWGFPSVLQPGNLTAVEVRKGNSDSCRGSGEPVLTPRGHRRSAHPVTSPLASGAHQGWK